MAEEEKVYPEFMGAKDAAQFLGVCPASLHNYANDGLVNRYVRGAPKRTFFKQSELNKLKQLKLKNQ
jgi:predicted site-specific integrase-resolvase